MKYLNSKYELFESEINEIIKKCKKYHIEKYEIDDDGFLTVFGNVDLSEKSLNNIPLMFKEVHGDFDISNNNIKSLFGSPLIVGESYYASLTKIKNLEHATVEVGKHFFCDNNNNLINIIHFPKHVGFDVFLWGCVKLSSLYGCLKFLNGSIALNRCYNINTLKYGPNKVLGSYLCSECKLKSLYGVSKYVGRVFDCSHNDLPSLKYSPRYIGLSFYFQNNNITSFEYFPDYVGGDINCGNNAVYNVWRLFKDKEHIEYFNQMNIISDDGKKINIKKLNLFLKSINKDAVKSVVGYENI